VLVTLCFGDLAVARGDLLVGWAGKPITTGQYDNDQGKQTNQNASPTKPCDKRVRAI
jgi:hypothetical protein